MFIAAMLLSLLVLATVILAGVQLVPSWVASWQAANGRYPTGRLTYAVPRGWDTTTLVGLNNTGSDAWLAAFDDTVTATSPTYVSCYTPSCATDRPDGARVDLESAAGHGAWSIEDWYQAWVAATARQIGVDVVLPLADYTRVPLGGQMALCAANQAGSQMLPPHPSPSPHFDSTFSGYADYGGAAVVMCFALWQGRAYYMQGTVQVHTASMVADLRDATSMLNSVRFV